MSTDIEGAAADRRRTRAFRQSSPNRAASNRPVDPPRQRRPALAALAVLLIVGGALAAGLVAVRMDSREPVLAAARAIPAGTLITAEDLEEVQVASEGLELISSDFADEVLNGGTYAKVPIQANSLVDQNMLTTETPVGEDRAVVAVPLNPALTPTDLASGDLVQVVRVAGGAGGASSVEDLGEGLVLSVTSASTDSLGGSQSGSVNLLVPTDAAPAVVDAAGSNLAGLALLDRGQSTDVELDGPQQ